MKARALAVVVVAALALGAAPAAAQVAVALSITDGDASQRHMASAVVGAARSRWQMLAPQLTTAETRACQGGDTTCLRGLAAKRNASHLLVVAVATLGVRDRVVAVQLFDVKQSAPLFEESAVQEGLTDELAEVRALASRLVQRTEPPAAVPAPVFTPVAPASDGLGVLGWTGVGVASAGALTAAGAGIGGSILGTQREPLAARNVMFYGLVAGGVLAAVGTAVVVVDAL